MKRFMIGQYGAFDYKKFDRDFREEFYGIEACLFENQEDIINLIEEAKNKKFNIGIHFPLRPDKSKLRDPFFLTQDNNIRKEAYEYAQNELEFLTKIKPTYILFHYPKPVILDDSVNWSNWRFTDNSEKVYESTYSFEEFKEKSEYMFEWLAKKSVEYNFIPVLEFDALNKYIYNTDFVENLLTKYNRIKLCLDTGRLHLQDRLDPNFNAQQIIEKYAKYAELIHLWNIKVNENVEYIHYPALQELDPNEGWAPIDIYFQIIKEENPNVKIMFEHKSDMISDDQLAKCYQWIYKLLS